MRVKILQGTGLYIQRMAYPLKFPAPCLHGNFDLASKLRKFAGAEEQAEGKEYSNRAAIL